MDRSQLAIFCMDAFVVPLYYRWVDAQAPHDDNHVQHLAHVTRIIADVPMGLENWMDTSGNIPSMRLITSSSY